MTARPRYRSPSGAVWRVVGAGDGCVTVALDRLPDGRASRLENRQTFTAAEIEVADGWEPLDDGSDGGRRRPTPPPGHAQTTAEILRQHERQEGWGR